MKCFRVGVGLLVGAVLALAAGNVSAYAERPQMRPAVLSADDARSLPVAPVQAFKVSEGSVYGAPQENTSAKTMLKMWCVILLCIFGLGSAVWFIIQAYLPPKRFTDHLDKRMPGWRDPYDSRRADQNLFLDH